jgi:hypothetical protein
MSTTKANEILRHAMENDQESLRGIDEALIALVLTLQSRIAELEESR